MKICHNCKGKGIVKCGNRKGECYYCRGKGIKNNYGRTKIKNELEDEE